MRWQKGGGWDEVRSYKGSGRRAWVAPLSKVKKQKARGKKFPRGFTFKSREGPGLEGGRTYSHPRGKTPWEIKEVSLGVGKGLTRGAATHPGGGPLEKEKHAGKARGRRILYRWVIFTTREGTRGKEQEEREG